MLIFPDLAFGLDESAFFFELVNSETRFSANQDLITGGCRAADLFDLHQSSDAIKLGWCRLFFPVLFQSNS